MSKPIIVIGGGIGGMTAALRLRLAGWPVKLIEQSEQLGGKMGEVVHDGFRWDTGPSVITMRHVLAELFRDLGTTLEDELDLQPVEPALRCFFPDGTTFDMSTHLPTMLGQIAALEPRDVDGYLRYLAYAARIYRLTGRAFIYSGSPSWKTLLRVPPTDALRIDAFRTMASAIASFVRHPKLRMMLGRFATYVGASPYLAPATLNVIAHVELNGGVWYPRGGIYAVARALERWLARTGVEVHRQAVVSTITTEGRAVNGVTLVDGRHWEAAAVVANVDVATVYRTLLPNPTANQAATRLPPSGSGAAFLWAVSAHHPQLAHHSLFFSRDYRAEFDTIWKRHQPGDDPTVYVAITARTDADHAPPGQENWFVLINTPPLGPSFDWAKSANLVRERVLAKLADFGLSLSSSISYEHTLTPVDIEQRTGAYRGALYGPTSNSRWTTFLRPSNRSRFYRGLYFVGGSTHPGGGVPMVMLSGKVVSERVIGDLGRATRPITGGPTP